jgi:glucokinase
MTVDRDGPVHVTGAAGPWELFGSGNALGALAREAAAAGRFAAVLAAKGRVDAVEGEDVRAPLEAGDPEALAVLDSFAVQVAVGVANLVELLDPEAVVLAGGVSSLGEPLRAAVQTHMASRLMGKGHRPVPDVVLAQLGVRAGAIGAALLAADAGGR